VITNPRAEIEALTWWLVEQVPVDDELAAVFAQVYSMEDLLFYNETAALRAVKSDIQSGHWHPRYALAA
jgi:hypothetical protein